MIPLYDIEIEADRSEDTREAAEAWYAQHDALRARIKASNRGEGTPSEVETTECWNLPARMLGAAD